MIRQYTYKFRLYPNKEQMSFINEQLGYNRFVYNFFLERSINLYKNCGIKTNYYTNAAILPLLKKGFPFLKGCNSQSLQATLKNLDAAFRNFFQHRAKFPNFKKKLSSNSISVPQHFGVTDSLLLIPKLKSGIKIKFHRKVSETVKSITITKNRAGKYYVNMLVEKAFTPLPKTNKVSGIDVGLKDFAAITSGANVNDAVRNKIPNPKYLIKSQARLKKLNRQFAKKKKGSKNKVKFRKRLAVLHEKVSNQRKDFLHKLSSRTVNDSQVIVLEDLNIKGMVKNRHLSKSIQDVSWSMFAGQLAYKADWYGREILKVNRFYPSSKTCSKCGSVKKDLNLPIREWTCPVCNAKHDRDINASANLFLEGLKIGRVSPELTPAEYAPAGMQITAYSRHTSKQEAAAS
ncbi:MAG: transposase [Deltaproteobacteria bacterium]|nr:transposase [Deltaproteobacteria bacterium]MCL5892336.1 transposase [Deltaproteobacteria bacterium]